MKGVEAMNKVRSETLYSILDEFKCYPSLSSSIDELVNPKYGVISSFQDIIDSINALKSQDLEKYSPF